jgi:hypothetical protein
MLNTGALNSLHQIETMRNIFWVGLFLIMIVACKKSRPEPIAEAHPPMLYKELSDSSIVFGKIASFDLDNNGTKDVLFSTQLVGDPVEQKDKKQWMITTSFTTSLPVNGSEQVPRLHYLDAIPVNDFSGFSWYNASSILLVQKTYTMTTAPYWEGDWKAASHWFIPVQLKAQDGVFNSWIEVSFNTDNEKLVLHRAGICKETNKAVLAGK